jgi:hypothetical protein
VAYWYPTAHASDDVRAETARSRLPTFGLGIDATDQLVPFQCSARVALAFPCPSEKLVPTDQTSVLEMASTPYRKLIAFASGLESKFQSLQDWMPSGP